MKNWAPILVVLILLGCDGGDEPRVRLASSNWPRVFEISCRNAFGQGWPPGFQASIDLEQERYSREFPRIGDGKIVRIDGPIIVLAEWTIPRGVDNNPEHFTVSFDRQTEILTRVHDYSGFIPGHEVRTLQCEVSEARSEGSRKP